MKTPFWTLCIIGTLSLQISIAQTSLSGTWYINGKTDQRASISQNGNSIVFAISGSSSNGYFTNNYTLYAKEWNTSAVLTTDGQAILWNNQLWTKSPFSGFPNISGSWSVNGQGAYTIEQDNIFFFINFQGKKVSGYFTGATSILVPEWNNTTATLSANGSQLTWNNQVWTKTGTSGPVVAGGITKKLCRGELSTFYYASQSLGTVWGRAATEPGRLSAEAIAACDAALVLLNATLEMMGCIVFDRNRITGLRSMLPSASSQQIVQQTEGIIRDLQAVVQSLRLSCDNGVSMLSLYVGGVHLGAAQAWASSQQCRAVPMPANIQSVIANHLTTASNALAPYARCIPQFNFGGFSMVTLGSMNSILPHTQITGIETQLLWAIALSDCCCTCSPGQTVTDVGQGSACDAECQKYCQSIGKRSGRYIGSAPCLMGVVSTPSTNCNCQ
ncbi:hypothetical protein [Emticicia agri]|uniref:Bulb-type lectin domain-containing protein n=1 Tax=Emticicia agri TaxID=2492393 RepID=A0A4Q5LVC1_9BACT|nr:hypothetical protein [Emticicia agri]RYU93403.1 hypothetical protein EWM59_22335 [Emticicia agri]